MPKWLRQIISAIIALIIFAASYPDVIVRGRVLTIPFIYILCVSIIPFLLRPAKMQTSKNGIIDTQRI
jgi:hypothetical protein